jgi:hypothetical protein
VVLRYLRLKGLGVVGWVEGIYLIEMCLDIERCGMPMDKGFEM